MCYIIPDICYYTNLNHYKHTINLKKQKKPLLTVVNNLAYYAKSISLYQTTDSAVLTTTIRNPLPLPFYLKNLYYKKFKIKAY